MREAISMHSEMHSACNQSAQGLGEHLAPLVELREGGLPEKRQVDEDRRVST